MAQSKVRTARAVVNSLGAVTLALGFATAAHAEECVYYNAMSALNYDSQPLTVRFCGEVIPVEVKEYIKARDAVLARRNNAFGVCNKPVEGDAEHRAAEARFWPCVMKIAKDLPAPTPTPEVVDFLSRHYRLTPDVAEALDNPPAYWNGLQHIFAGKIAETWATVRAYDQFVKPHDPRFAPTE